ncbi:hypothetical protein LI063_03530 [Clostridium perfringens]|uniref:hypothetical protein n=1 Tax=Clostridium perfringens TaxID=1502 RepID=UPI002245D9CE|nr:hypothetical protein [Clostridium perfringens]MCX0363235.1 hypothetical protein [Clostridium perfringens]
MKFIVNRKKFDTDKAELIVSYTRGMGLVTIPSIIDLYKTQSGKWIEVDTNDLRCKEIKTEDVENIFLTLNKVELYEKYFGKLEEV